NNRQPDVLDFFITKGLARFFFGVETCLDGSSDHVPVVLTASTTVLNYEKPLILHNYRTDWDAFREILEDTLQLQVTLKSEVDIENATKEITMRIQEACWKSTPEIVRLQPRQKTVRWQIKSKIQEKRRLRRIWHDTRHPDDKTAFNRSIRELKDMIIEENDATNQTRIESLSPNKASNYSLWKEFKNISRPVIAKPPLKAHPWARSPQEKADLFANHLANIFMPNAASPNVDESNIDEILRRDFQLDLPLECVTPKEIRRTVCTLKDKKAPGFDLIDKKVLMELPRKGIMFLTILFNSIIRIGYFPLLWKVSQIIMICKPGKPNHDIVSYRPISLLPLLSKLFEMILLKRLLGAIAERKILPDHQFGFRREHATVEQVHRVCQVIRKSLEQKEYCSSAFLDIQQAFDRVWHKGLLCKIKMLLPHSFYTLLKSYLTCGMFQVREGECMSGFYDINAGVPQGSVLGPVLYTLFTVDLPQSPGVTVATFADDTAILASHTNPVKASEILQKSPLETQMWMEKWRITASPAKSLHITFTLRTGDCPPVKLGNNELPHTRCRRLAFTLV
ncbi:jg844, partial [Pararge aegeria aegeria]